MNNYIIKHIANVFSPVFHNTGLSSLVKLRYGGDGHILMFHRVLEEDSRRRIHNHRSLEVTTAQLEAIIGYFNKNGYSCISLDELYKGLVHSELPHKYVVYTFDDGYSDNYHYAYPIFKKHNIPFAIYLTTSFPNRTANLWWYALEDILLNNDILDDTPMLSLRGIKVRTTYQKEMAFNAIRDKLLNMEEQSQKAFFELFKIDLTAYVKNMALTWNEVVSLSEDPLVTIGAHTVSHLSLATLNEIDCFKEMSLSKVEIENKIKKAVYHFSYPFGKSAQAGIREFEIAEKVGFKTATTTRLANVFEEHKSHLLSLPRITINSQTRLIDLKAQLNGVYPMFRNKFQRVVTI